MFGGFGELVPGGFFPGHFEQVQQGLDLGPADQASREDHDGEQGDFFAGDGHELEHERFERDMELAVLELDDFDEVAVQVHETAGHEVVVVYAQGQDALPLFVSAVVFVLHVKILICGKRPGPISEDNCKLR